MLKYNTGDILKVKSGIIVHGCNAQGVMGSGLAKQIKTVYPDCYKSYKSLLAVKGLGHTIWYPAKDGLWIVNAITQKFYGREPGTRYTDYTAVKSCFEYVFRYAAETSHSIHIPDMIGCGLGGGDRETVLSIIERAMGTTKFKNDLVVWSLD